MCLQGPCGLGLKLVAEKVLSQRTLLAMSRTSSKRAPFQGELSRTYGIVRFETVEPHVGTDGLPRIRVAPKRLFNWCTRLSRSCQTARRVPSMTGGWPSFHHMEQRLGTAYPRSGRGGTTEAIPVLQRSRQGQISQLRRGRVAQRAA